MEIMAEAICKEIELRKNELAEPVETIYFGGGTPSFMPVETVDKIIDAARSNFDIYQLTELTLEANPDDITLEKLTQWKKSGVNRLSIGVQSFFDNDLKWMNRAHNATEAENCIKLALAEGFEVSIDLIFGLPESNNAQWQQNLEKAIALGVHHLSCYGLTLEENTPWKKLIERGKYKRPDEISTAEQFENTMDFLGNNGWEHYEISNYCRPGYMAKHNTAYWQQKKYLGFGPAAHSFNGIERKWNIADNLAYMQSIEQGALPMEKEMLTPVNNVNEYLMTGLRTLWGVDLQKIKEMGFYNNEMQASIEKYLQQNMLKKEGSIVTLTDKGKVYADAIAGNLFVT